MTSEDPTVQPPRRLRATWRTNIDAPGLPAAQVVPVAPPADLVELPAPPVPRDEPVPDPGAGVVDLRTGGKGIPSTPARPLWHSLVAFIVLPVVFGLVYWGLICSPRYTATAQVAMRSESESPSGNSALSLLSQSVGLGSAPDDGRMLLAYVPSGDLLDKLEQRLPWREHVSAHELDPFTRLSKDASRETRLAFWHDRVGVHIDQSTGLIHIEVQAYDPAFALQACKTVVAICEEQVNRLSQDLVRSRRDFLEQELTQAEDHLRQSKLELVQFQDTHGVLDPAAEAGSISSAISNIEMELIKARASLAELLSIYGAESENIERAKTRITSLEEQLITERKRILGGSDKPMNALAIRYQELLLQVGFRNETYRAMLSAFQTATTELNHKLKHLQVMVSPVQPEEKSNPRVFYNTLLLLLTILILWFVVSTAIAIVREHLD